MREDNTMDDEKKYEEFGFTISNQESLRKLYEFKDKHKRTCWDKYHDVTGALLAYTAIPTGVGVFYTVECECGDKLLLSEDCF